ncbi:MAG: hypothetical protein JWM41_652 [Gemmatimonadetes bacterium]|nr:hypothetical protein [Gemmatimonadota bacterium]
MSTMRDESRLSLVSTYSDPVTLFGAAIHALNRDDWHGVARLCDPASLTFFKRNLIESLSPPAEQSHKLTATELMKAVPSMPRAVAEYQVTRFRESLDPKQRLRDQVPSVKSLAALEAMTPAAVFAAWLEGKSIRRQVDRNVELRRMTRATANEVVAQGEKQFNFKGLGYVDDGDRIAHIVYRRDDSIRGPFLGADEPSLAGRSDAEIQFVGDGWGREAPLTVMARRQFDDSWLLVASLDFLLVDQIAFISESPEP